MRRNRRNMLVPLIVLLTACIGCSPQAAAPTIAPEADQALRAMSDTLGNASAFEFRGVGTMDEVLETGQLSQFTRTSKIVALRPDKLHVDTDGDDVSRLVWYDGTTLTVLDRSDSTYASIAVPYSIEEMVDFVVEEYGLTVPVADLLFRNTYESLITNVESGEYLGLHTVDEHACHHLLFRQELIDWQIWIDADKSVPRKLLIIYKTEPGQPRFCVTLDGWNLAAEPSDDVFEFVPSADATRVEMADLLTAGKGE